MRLNNLVWVLVIFVLASPVLGMPLNLSNSSVVGSVEKGLWKDFSITVLNSNDFDVYNVHVESPVFDFVSVRSGFVNLSNGVQGNLVFGVLANETFSSTNFGLDVVFDYRILDDASPVMIPIEIKNSEWNVSDLVLRVGDSLDVYNRDPIDHTFSDVAGSFYVVVPDESNIQRTFDVIGDYLVYDGVNGDTFDLGVVSSETLIFGHRESDDVGFTLSLESVYPKTNVSVEWLTGDFSGVFNETFEGVGKITNKGENKAEDIFMDMLWTVFKSDGVVLNNFTLASGQSKIFTYFISPVINRTSQTNQSYELVANVSGKNFPSFQSSPVSLFIEFAEFGQVYLNGSSVFILDFDAMKEYCQSHSDDDRCDFGFRDVERVVEVYPDNVINFTRNETLLIKNFPEILQREFNRNNELRNNMSGLIESFSNALNIYEVEHNKLLDFVNKSETERLKDKEQTDLILIIVFVGFALVLAGGGGYWYYTYRLKLDNVKKTEGVDGGKNYD